MAHFFPSYDETGRFHDPLLRASLSTTIETRVQAAASEWGTAEPITITDASLAAVAADDESAFRIEANKHYATPAQLADKADTAALAGKVSKGELAVNLADFGAVGDGVVDDTAAVQAFFNHLATNGGTGTGRGTFRVTARVEISKPERAFRFTGHGTSTVFALDTSGATSVIFVQEAIGASFTDFIVDGGRATNPTQAHGITVQNCQGVRFERVKVRNYGDTAILCMYNHTYGGESFNNHIVACEADGGGLANNGFMHESSSFSTMSNCHVRGLNKAGDPSYGLQLKNNTSNCAIYGGSVTDAKVGVAFGNTTGALTTNALVRGVLAVNCNYGLIMGHVQNSDIEMNIDMADNPAAVAAVRVGALATSNTVNVAVRRTPAAAPVFDVNDSRNQLALRKWDGAGQYLARLRAGVAYTRVQVGPLEVGAATTPGGVLDESGATSNTVQWSTDLAELEALTPAGVSRLRFPSLANRNARVEHDHAAGAFRWFPGGTAAAQMTADAFHPFFAAGMSLGSSSRGWTAMFLRSPNGVVHKVTVDDTGAVKAVPA